MRVSVGRWLTGWRSLGGHLYVLSALALFAGAVVVTPTASADGGEEPVELGSGATLPGKPKYPRLDSQLSRMVEQLGQMAPQEVVHAASLYQGTSVAVTVRLSGDATTTLEFLDQGGATVANAGGDYIERWSRLSEQRCPV